MKRYRLYISGEDVDAASGASFDALNPTTGEIWATHALAGAEDVDHAVRAAAAAFENEAWRGLSPTRRGRLMMRWADLIAERAEAIAEVEVADNGKLFKEMVGQLRAIPDWLYYFGGLADKVEGRVIPLDRTSVLNYTLREPLGVIGIIIPWNSPVLLTMYSLAPALAAGNTIVVKPSEHASASVIETLRLATEVGFPRGVLNVVTGEREAGEALVEHPAVAKISFTGSERTGAAIAAKAGARLAPVALELGGKSPNIVFPDATLDAAEAGVLAGIFAAGGQSCVAGSRALFHREIYDELLERVQRRAAEVVLGDPMDGTTQMGRRRCPRRRRRDPRHRRRVPTRALVRPDHPRRRRQRRPDRTERGLRAGTDRASVRDGGGGDRDCERHPLRPRSWRLDTRPQAWAPTGAGA